MGRRKQNKPRRERQTTPNAPIPSQAVLMAMTQMPGTLGCALARTYMERLKVDVATGVVATDITACPHLSPMSTDIDFSCDPPRMYCGRWECIADHEPTDQGSCDGCGRSATVFTPVCVKAFDTTISGHVCASCAALPHLLAGPVPS